VRRERGKARRGVLARAEWRRWDVRLRLRVQVRGAVVAGRRRREHLFVKDDHCGAGRAPCL
jgi:hypothetical protein